jgi:hypothetical protein
MYSVLENNNTQFRMNNIRIHGLSKRITHNLRNLDELNRPIVYPDNRIIDVLTKLEYNNEKVSPEEIDSMVVKLVCDTIRNEVETIRYNNSLDKFDTIFGDFNKHGLSRTSQIKVRNKRPTPMMFHLRY